MKAVVIREHGSYDKLLFEERETPEPGPGQVRIRVHAAGLNHLDTWVRRGVEGAKFPLPLIPGSDAAGIVDAVGPGVTRWVAGDAVILAPGMGCGECAVCATGQDQLCRRYAIFGETCDGACADFVVCPARNVLPRPEGMSDPEAASFGLTFLTAWHMLVGRAELRPHETVLIHAAGSGVSVAAIQIARMIGARVLVTAGSEAKLSKAKELGAEEGIPYRELDFAKEVRKLTAKRGVDVVIDHVGEETFSRSVQCLSKGGRLVTCGGTSGPSIATDVRLVFFKGLSILGSTMGSLGELHTIVEHFRRGDFRPVIHSVLPMSEVREGHRILQDREVVGKVILTNDG